LSGGVVKAALAVARASKRASGTQKRASGRIGTVAAMVASLPRRPIMGTWKVCLAIRTSNPNNGATGNTRWAGIAKTRKRREQRLGTKNLLIALLGPRPPMLPVEVTVRRVAPSAGLDPHDGLGASLKSVIDGIADWLGLPKDRDPRVRWALDQRRGKPGEYAVDVEIRAVCPCETDVADPGPTHIASCQWNDPERPDGCPF